ncbi:IPT/TIG domain-containing protein [Plantactinospora sp. CA-290183]|uniref:IPT/TIG domain-containing protein n=1 Tax=Plantactinospora sp. CA-290183 TaxID=3240006 RepID=UPI003D8BC6C1
MRRPSRVPGARALAVVTIGGLLAGVASALAGAGPAAAGPPPTLRQAPVNTSAAPAITGFSPAGGDRGTAFSIQGSGFVPDPVANTVTINGVTATVTAATESRLDAVVPSGTGPGRVTVANADGSATSADHFVVPPTGYAFADISHTATISVDGADVVASITGQRKVSVLRFDGTAGQRISLGLDRGTMTSRFDVKPFGPNGAQLRTPDGFIVQQNLPREGGQFLLPPLPVTGTYALVIDPTTDTGGGQITVTSPSIVDVGSISATGDAVQLPFAKPWQYTRLGFTATAGKDYSLTPSEWTFSTSSAQSTIRLFDPDGQQVTFFVASRTARSFAFTAERTGDYTIMAVIDTLGGTSQTGSYRLTLSEHADVGEVVVNGAAKPLSITRLGQHQKLTFAGRAGQRLGFGITDVQDSAFFPAITVITPDGSRRWDLFSSLDSEIVEPLPVDGTYQLIVNPFTTGAYNLWVSEDVDGGALAVDGSPAQVTVARPGQNVRFTVSGTSGQRLGWAMVPSWSSGMIATVLAPSGQQLLAQGVSRTVDVPRLPATGDYQFIADLGVVTGSATFHLSTDLDAGQVTVGGDPLTMTLTRPGQNVRATFEGTAGSRFSAGFTDATLSGQYRLRVFQPNGQEVAGPFPDVHSGRDDKDITLPVTGRYEIELDPVDSNVNTGSVRVTLSTAVDAGPITIGGSTVRLELPRAGQDGVASFDATAGQPLVLTFAGSTFVNDTSTRYYRVTVLAPNGQPVPGFNGLLQTADGDLSLIPTVAGRYRLIIDPDRAGTGGVTLGVKTP